MNVDQYAEVITLCGEDSLEIVDGSLQLLRCECVLYTIHKFARMCVQ